jgi:hypothetical protein
MKTGASAPVFFAAYIAECIGYDYGAFELQGCGRASGCPRQPGEISDVLTTFAKSAIIDYNLCQLA